MDFIVQKTETSCRARTGLLKTAHSAIETPVFMPVGTKATVKTLTPRDIEEIGYNIILANSFHLYLKPGLEVINAFNGIHTWMGWDRSLLTDSGGFQIYSLADSMKLSDEGVTFQSSLDGGKKHFIGPREAMDIQIAIGADIVMAFDECTSTENPTTYIREAMERTHKWAEICVEYFHEKKRDYQSLFGIVQGGLSENLRTESAAFIQSLPFSGISIGGLSVGEGHQEMYSMLSFLSDKLDEKRPHYLMGVGEPLDILHAVEQGIDMFDCVMPTRMARTGTALTHKGRVNLRNAECRLSEKPLESGCDCYCCKHFSRSYIRHLIMEKEILGIKLITSHNLAFMKQFMDEIRASIERSEFSVYKKDFIDSYSSAN